VVVAGRDASSDADADAGCCELAGEGFDWAPAIDADSRVTAKMVNMERRETVITLRCSRKGDTTIPERPPTRGGVRGEQTLCRESRFHERRRRKSGSRPVP
jgi:hypothetical protein